jgi:hypothetical protein
MLLLLTLFFNLTFTDIKTGEKLTGVEVKTNKSIYYSNLEGEVSIPKDEIVCEISMVSYEKIDTSFTNFNGVIKLK